MRHIKMFLIGLITILTMAAIPTSIYLSVVYVPHLGLFLIGCLLVFVIYMVGKGIHESLYGPYK